MKHIYLVIIILLYCSCEAQVKKETTNEKFLSVSAAVDNTKILNKEIIATLELFLKSKNNSAIENPYWDAADFEKYEYPYGDIFQIERSKHGGNHFKPSLMEIIPTDEPNKKMVMIAFIGRTPDTGENIVRAIFNILAVKNKSGIIFQRPMDYLTKGWQRVEHESIEYMITPLKTPNKNEMKKQAEEIKTVCDFFETNPIPIKYYSCKNPKETFEIKGIEYIPNMYFNTTGGMAEYDNIIFSGNNSEIYTHEIIHIYTHQLFPKMDRLLDEGMATWIGGSGKFSYQWHREKMKNYLKNNEVDFTKHLAPYERFYIEEETPVPYMIGAVICERTMRKFGKEKLFELLKSELSFWEIMKRVGVTKENFNEEIQKELSLPMVSY